MPSRAHEICTLVAFRGLMATTVQISRGRRPEVTFTVGAAA
jgi:hypothetical protein